MNQLIERLRIHPYDLPLRRAWGSARGGFDRRRGWLLEISAGGLHGFGDCAPLPAAGTETTDAAWNALCRLQTCVAGRTPDNCLMEMSDALAATPATRFALDCALCDLNSRRLDLPLRRWLADRAENQVPVNAMLGPLERITPADLQMACEAGFKVLKIKVGLDDPSTELVRLIDLAGRLPPGIALRLDANGAWSPDAARRWIDGLAGLPIESIEEPLRNPDPDRLAALQEGVDFPLARDESLPAWSEHFDPSALGVRRIVLKPAVIGGLVRSRLIAEHALVNGIQVVVTSLVESAAGLWPTAQLAAVIGGPIPHGLATAGWLAEDLGPAPQPSGGWIHLPRTAGSGFAPHV